MRGFLGRMHGITNTGRQGSGWVQRGTATAAALCLVGLCTGTAWAEEVSQPLKPQSNAAVLESFSRLSQLKGFEQAMDELYSPQHAEARLQSHLEMVRIASPSRSEQRRAAEMVKRFKAYGFTDDEIKYKADGTLEGAGLQLVDGLPVCNACVEIKGTYKGSQNPRPKVLLEAHIDSVNPSLLPPASAPYSAVKLQPLKDPVVNSPAELKALPLDVVFKADGSLDTQHVNYALATKRFDSLEAALKGNAYRVYVPGYSDAMGNTNNVLHMANLLKKYNIKPYYDLWICATAGEEGRGNLAGMKQLYGYNQDEGKGNNKLNFVANVSADGSFMALHYVGSYRYEVAYTGSGGSEGDFGKKPNPVMAAANAINGIANLTTPNEEDPSRAKTTYTVGYLTTKPTAPTAIPKEMSLEVDMRSLVPNELNEMRDRLKPWFEKGAALENAKYGLDASSPDAIKVEFRWFGDRPAHKRDFALMHSDPLVQAAWFAWEAVGNDLSQKTLPQYPKDSSSLNDNIPAALGIPSVNINLFEVAAGGNGHSYAEWGVPGSAQREANNIKRALLTVFTVAGFENPETGELTKPVYGETGSFTTKKTW